MQDVQRPRDAGERVLVELARALERHLVGVLRRVAAREEEGLLLEHPARALGPGVLGLGHDLLAEVVAVDVLARREAREREGHLVLADVADAAGLGGDGEVGGLHLERGGRRGAVGIVAGGGEQGGLGRGRDGGQLGRLGGDRHVAVGVGHGTAERRAAGQLHRGAGHEAAAGDHHRGALGGVGVDVARPCWPSASLPMPGRPVRPLPAPRSTR